MKYLVLFGLYTNLLHQQGKNSLKYFHLLEINITDNNLILNFLLISYYHYWIS